jgi:hypothetical protein
LRVVNVHPGQVTETEMAGKAKDNEGSEHLRAHIDDGEWDDMTCWESGADECVAQLAGDFTVWLASEEARFLKGKFVWVNWDVDELKGKTKEIENTALLTLGLEGFSGFST